MRKVILIAIVLVAVMAIVDAKMRGNGKERARGEVCKEDSECTAINPNLMCKRGYCRRPGGGKGRPGGGKGRPGGGKGRPGKGRGKGKGRPMCSEDSDCTDRNPNFKCKNGRCKPGRRHGGLLNCTEDAFCKTRNPDFTCQEGHCKLLNCINDADCAIGATCQPKRRRNVCLSPPCTSDDDCTIEGEKCLRTFPMRKTCRVPHS